MEEHRRTEAGRVRTAKEFVSQFFPWDERSAKDLVFQHVPAEVRGPVVAAWGIRGIKAALRDDDEKIKLVVHDAFNAGDIDDAAFEQGLTAQIIVDWIPLVDWWKFWRNGKLTGVAIQKALAVARELALIDDRWFLLNVQGRGGKLKGTDVLCDTLSKDQIVAWVRKVHESGDGSPAGLVAALGWDMVLTKTAQDALLFALDAFARKAGLAPELVADAPPVSKPVPNVSTPPSSVEPSTARGPTENLPTVTAPGDATLAAAEADAAMLASTTSTLSMSAHDDGMPVAIPDMPAIDSMAPPEDGDSGTSESPRLAEAREQMLAMLGDAKAPPAPVWEDSEVPAKPSSLEWPEPAVLVGPNGRSSQVVPDIAPSEDLIAIDEDAVMSDRSPAPAPVAASVPAPVPAPPPPMASKPVPRPPVPKVPVKR